MTKKSDQEQRQQDSHQQLLSQGSSLEVLTKQNEWEYIKKYFTEKVQAFTNEILVSDDPIEEFEEKRQRIKGLRDLFGWIEASIQAVEDDREKARKTPKKR